VLAVLPAPYMIDFERLRLVIDAQSIRLATEREMAALYPECEVGSMPPMGHFMASTCLWTEVWSVIQISSSTPARMPSPFECITRTLLQSCSRRSARSVSALVALAQPGQGADRAAA